MTWLVEQPVTIFALGLVTLAIMAGALVHTGRRIFLYAVFAVVLLTAGMLLIERLAVTEVERVEATLYALANDLRKNDAEAVLQHISTGSPDVLMDAKRYQDGRRKTEEGGRRREEGRRMSRNAVSSS